MFILQIKIERINVLNIHRILGNSRSMTQHIRTTNRRLDALFRKHRHSIIVISQSTAVGASEQFSSDLRCDLMMAVHFQQALEPLPLQIFKIVFVTLCEYQQCLMPYHLQYRSKKTIIIKDIQVQMNKNKYTLHINNYCSQYIKDYFRR